MKAGLSQKIAMTFRCNPIMKAIFSQKTALAFRHSSVMKEAIHRNRLGVSHSSVMTAVLSPKKGRRL
jgi:hypothetical protein